MAKLKTKYVCQQCASEQPRWMGKCPECNAWNSLVEEAVSAPAPTGAAKPGTFKSPAIGRAPQRLRDVSIHDEERFSSGLGELDRVLGGGVVPGSLVLLGGDPGIGKSTLLLQVAQHLAGIGRRVLYVSGEESARQIRMRARRLGAENDHLYVLAETDMSVIAATLSEVQPEWAVIDSIQAIYDPDLNSAPGSVSQVRGATGTLMRLAKDQGISLCIVGHVTKEGTLAGPRVLEHMVDTVLYFEGDRFKSYRLVRAVKNRFGSTNEVGLFEMQEAGLQEVTNPSAVFLAERTKETTGSAIVSTMEGTRPLLVEIQALVSPSTLASPRRASTGIEHNRMVQILAVLEKRVGLPLSKYDVYVNVVGGLSIEEPAGDLGVALAVASSMRDVALAPEAIAMGEVGLNGEIRGVNGLEARLKEAAKLGFTKAIVPAHSLDDKSLRLPKGLEVVGVNRLYDAIVKATLAPEGARG
ncbi:MAG TPA: DNA repair protein RadA [Pantanalinema sp.]